jgi:hypothetical protein
MPPETAQEKGEAWWGEVKRYLHCSVRRPLHDCSRKRVVAQVCPPGAEEDALVAALLAKY